MSAHIRIQRAHSTRDRLNSYGVFIDGKKVGKVKDNAELEVEVSPGEHQVQLRADIFNRGKAITVNVADGGTSLLLTSGGSLGAALGAGFGLAGAVAGAAIDKARAKGQAESGQLSVRRLQLIELTPTAE